MVGIGFTADATASEVLDALALLAIDLDDVATFATTDRRAGHPVVAGLYAEGFEVRLVPPDTLALTATPTPSAVVARAAGTPSVAEAAALVVASSDGLEQPKRVVGRVTVAVARRRVSPSSP